MMGNRYTKTTFTNRELDTMRRCLSKLETIRVRREEKYLSGQDDEIAMQHLIRSVNGLHEAIWRAEELKEI